MKYFALALAVLIQTAFSKELPIAPPQFGRDHPLHQAADLYRHGWKDSATALAQPLAEKGDKDAWFLLGLLLEEQAPARLSRAQAMEYAYRQAAAAGHPEAGFRRLITGIGSTGEESVRKSGTGTLEAAAAGNDPVAHRILGELRLRGFADGKSNPEKARESWQRAAGLGDKPSLLLLAKLAEGVFPSDGKADPAAALKHYRQAADAGDTAAALRLGELLLPGSDADEGKRRIARAIAAGAAEGHALLGDHAAPTDSATARLHYGKGAAAGDSRSMVRLAALLLVEDPHHPDAIRWLEQAAALRNADAAALLGAHHLGKQPAKGYPFLIDAARNGIPQAQADLATLYLAGTLGRPDPHAAVTWLTEAMKSGDAGSQYRLGLLHEQGTGTPVNYANAGVLYTMACNKGHAAAAAGIARMSAEGLGTQVNPVQAWAYATLSIQRGDVSASALLADLNQKISDADRERGREALAKLQEGMNPGPKPKD